MFLWRSTWNHVKVVCKESCESRLQERISEVEMPNKQVCITSNCQYKPVYTLYVRTFVCTCMCVNYTFGQQHGQVHAGTYLHTKHVAYYILL